MKKVIFNRPEKDLQVCLSFAYCINPEDYVPLTSALIKYRNLFSDIEKLRGIIKSGRKLAFEEERLLINSSYLLKNYKNLESEPEYHNYISEIINDFETYRYFYKEISASLKFNPLSRSDAGKHVLDKLLHFIEMYNALISPKVILRNIEVKPDENGLSVIGTKIHFDNKKLRIFSNHSSVKDSMEISPQNLIPKNVIVYVVTIGPGIDDEIKHLMEKGEMFDAYLLNGIGAGATEMVANDLNRYMNDLNTEESYVYRRISPGYGDWNVSDQTKIFELLNPEKYIGVKLTDSHIMLPEKSTSGIMGLILKDNSDE